MNKHEDVVQALNDSRVEFKTSGFELSDLYNLAHQKGLLQKLHSIFLDFCPDNINLSRVYHWKNLKSSLDQLVNDKDNSNKLINAFIDYYINFGQKHLIIDQVDDINNFLSQLSHVSSMIPEFGIEDLGDNIDLDVSPQSLRLIGKTQTADYVSLLFCESIVFYKNEVPSDHFFTSAGLQIKSQFLIKKQVEIKGYHKLIFDKKSKTIIILIDDQLLQRNETSVDKLMSIKAHLNNFFFKTKNYLESSYVYFFNSIQELYRDKSVGEVWGGYFLTSSSTSYIPGSRGRGDLRIDSFQKGGEKADQQQPQFSKLHIGWPNIDGTPEIYLNGNGEMFASPDTRLSSALVTFSTDLNSPSTFLREVLKYANWHN